MSTVLLIIGLITVAIVPLVMGLPTSMRRSSQLVMGCIVAAVIGVLWAIYWVTLANPHHTKHALLFAALAVVALVGASFSRPMQTA